jgi:hypothetical protein
VLILLAVIVWLVQKKRAKSLAQGDWLFSFYFQPFPAAGAQPKRRFLSKILNGL